MPYPDSFPTYATSLILMTVLSRLVQLPFAYKVRNVAYRRAKLMHRTGQTAL